MQAIIDTNTMLLRYVTGDDTEIEVMWNNVVMPRLIIKDMGIRNTAIMKIKGDVLPGMTKDEMIRWRTNPWRYDPTLKEFCLVRL